MSNENENENEVLSEEKELQLAAAAVAGLNNVVNMVQGISSNVRNIRYTPQTNTTTYYGHTNFEELKVNNNNVALTSQIPDITGKANVNHSHSAISGQAGFLSQPVVLVL